MTTRVVLEPLEGWEDDDETRAEIVDELQETLTADLDYDDDGNVCLLLGIDDTLADDYDGGPCNGFEAMIRIPSIADLLIESEKEAREISDEIGKQLDERDEIMEDFAVYLEGEAAKLRAAFPKKPQ